MSSVIRYNSNAPAIPCGNKQRKSTSGRHVALSDISGITLHPEDENGQGYITVGGINVPAHKICDYSSEDSDHLASFTITADATTYEFRLYRDFAEVSISFYCSTTSEVPRSAFDVREFDSLRAFAHYMLNEVIPAYQTAEKQQPLTTKRW